MAPQGRGEMQSVGPLSVVTDPGVCLAGTGMWEYLRRATRMERREWRDASSPVLRPHLHLGPSAGICLMPHCSRNNPIVFPQSQSTL